MNSSEYHHLKCSNSQENLLSGPNSSERFRDQIHNKTTLTDSDRMAYQFQNLDGAAKKVVESLVSQVIVTQPPLRH